MNDIIYQPYTLSIANGETRELSCYGRFLSILSNNQLTDVKVRIGTSGRLNPIPQGISLELPEDESFDMLHFYNDSGSTMVIQIAISAGKIFDNRLVIDTSSPVPTQPGFTSGTYLTTETVTLPGGLTDAHFVSDHGIFTVQNIGLEALGVYEADQGAVNLVRTLYPGDILELNGVSGEMIVKNLGSFSTNFNIGY